MSIIRVLSVWILLLQRKGQKVVNPSPEKGAKDVLPFLSGWVKVGGGSLGWINRASFSCTKIPFGGLPRWLSSWESTGQCLPIAGGMGSILGQKDLLEKEMATHSSILTWEIPWTEELGVLQSMGLQRVGHDWACIHIVFFTTWIFLFPCLRFSSVAQSCPTLCDPMNCSTPGLPVHHQLPEFTQTHVHRVGDAIQPSHPLSSPSPPAPNPSQHQRLFQ